MRSLEEIEAEAKSLKASASVEANKAGGNLDLSPQGQRSARKKVLEATNERLDQLEREHAEVRKGLYEEARKRLFSAGLSEDLLARRDAAGRASQISTPNDALPLLRTAERQQDKTLSVEILNVAIERKWTDVVREFIELYPADAGDVNKVWAGSSGSQSLTSESRAERLLRSIVFSRMR